MQPELKPVRIDPGAGGYARANDAAIPAPAQKVLRNT